MRCSVPGARRDKDGSFPSRAPGTKHRSEATWQERILACLADYSGLPAPRLQPHLDCFEGAPAARHLD